MTLYNDFPSDAHRRVAGNLSQPRSLRSLVRVLDSDPHTPLTLADNASVAVLLRELEEAGDVVNLGDVREARELAASALHEDAITLHPEKADLLVERADAQPGRYLDPGYKWLLSKQGLEKLTGPAPPDKIPLLPPAPEPEPQPVDLSLWGRLRRRR